MRNTYCILNITYGDSLDILPEYFTLAADAAAQALTAEEEEMHMNASASQVIP